MMGFHERYCTHTGIALFGVGSESRALGDVWKTSVAKPTQPSLSEARSSRVSERRGYVKRSEPRVSNGNRSPPSYFDILAPSGTSSLKRSTGCFAVHAIPRSKRVRKIGSSNVQL
ncbi:hypothetical protein Pla52n_06610 [Stieleria varia]|uniref:Uncharacterized protein n=1 Tax=Stieleria varia TaxID=2528005 RepID=A0A5C6B800_9BACT|nr:hypothetical protein Pla52n_06610 [Stieleria varia]